MKSVQRSMAHGACLVPICIGHRHSHGASRIQQRRLLRMVAERAFLLSFCFTCLQVSRCSWSRTPASVRTELHAENLDMGSSTASHQRNSMNPRLAPGAVGGSAVRPPMGSGGLDALRAPGMGTGKVPGGTPDVLLRSALEEHGGTLRPLLGRKRCTFWWLTRTRTCVAPSARSRR